MKRLGKKGWVCVHALRAVERKKWLLARCPRSFKRRECRNKARSVAKTVFAKRFNRGTSPHRREIKRHLIAKFSRTQFRPFCSVREILPIKEQQQNSSFSLGRECRRCLVIMHERDILRASSARGICRFICGIKKRNGRKNYYHHTSPFPLLYELLLKAEKRNGSTKNKYNIANRIFSHFRWEQKCEDCKSFDIRRPFEAIIISR